MTENADFVNSYIERLNKTIHDLTGRNVILETRIEVAERATSQIALEIEVHKNEIAARSNQIDQVFGDNKRLSAEVASLKEQLRLLNEPKTPATEEVEEADLNEVLSPDSDEDDF